MFIVKHNKSHEEYIAVISFLHWKNAIVGADGEDSKLKKGVTIFDVKNNIIARGFDEIYKYVERNKL